MDKRNLIKLMIFFIFIALTPVFTALTGTNFFLTQLTMSFYYALVSVGLCMLMGYAGQISMGQAAFFSIGGYTTAVLTTLNFLKFREFSLIQFLLKYGLIKERFINAFQGFVSFLIKIHLIVLTKNTFNEDTAVFYPWAAFIIAVILSLAISFIIGLPSLKLKGHYLAMATMGFGIIVLKFFNGTKEFGLADGIAGVPGFKILPFLEINGSMNSRIINFYFAGILLLSGLVLLINLISSRAGRALRSLHGSEEASNSMGINTSLYKIFIFMLGAVYASISGVFMTHYIGGIGLSEVSVMKSVRYVAIVAVGGMSNIWGTLVFAVILNFLSLRGVFGKFDDAVFGIILILVMIFAPKGFNKENLRELLKKIRFFADYAAMRVKGIINFFIKPKKDS